MEETGSDNIPLADMLAISPNGCSSHNNTNNSVANNSSKFGEICRQQSLIETIKTIRFTLDRGKAYNILRAWKGRRKCLKKTAPRSLSLRLINIQPLVSVLLNSPIAAAIHSNCFFLLSTTAISFLRTILLQFEIIRFGVI